MSEEIKQLLDGNKKFRNKYFSERSTLFDELQLGQRPKIMIVACCDSRVDPAVIFNCQPGQLFTIRNIANLIPPCEDATAYHGTSAALEFGVCFLQVSHIMVFGHTQCGGIQALLEQTKTPLNNHSFISKWMELAQPAYTKVMAEHSQASATEQALLCGQYALINSLNNLRSFPWIQERIQQGTLSVHAWYFDLATGGVHQYDEQTAVWVAPTDAPHQV